MIDSKLFATMIMGTALAGCASQPAVPSPTTKTMILEQALVGRTAGDGILVNGLTGQETKFSVVIDGTWDGKFLTLVEEFVYSDGAKERKTWHLTKISDVEYQGTRDDIIGTAKVYQDGRAVRLNYALAVNTGIGNIAVRFRDLLSLQDDGSIANRAIASKFGLRVGRIILTLHRTPQSTLADVGDEHR